MAMTSNRQPPIGTVQARSLVATHGSPLYVYCAEHLRHAMAEMEAAIDHRPTTFHFASVTNGNLALLRLVREHGWGLHANSPGDVFLGLKAGFSAERIVYSGSNLNYHEMEQLLDWGVRLLNLDSLDQLSLCCDLYRSRPRPPLTLGLRLNHPPLTGDSRIGVSPQDFPQAITIASQVGLTIQGLHVYRGTGTKATAAFTGVIQPLLSLARSLPDWTTLDLGGGFGYPYRLAEAPFDWRSFGVAITEALRALDRPIHLRMEPGRAAIAGSAVLLTTVVSTKWQADKQIVGVDTSIANLAVLSVHGGHRQVVHCGEDAMPSPLVRTDVCGNTTYSRDYLARDGLLPRLQIGDLLMILDVGAYGFAMSSHFLHRPRPAEVLLQEGTARVIREREGLADLLRHQPMAD